MLEFSGLAQNKQGAGLKSAAIDWEYFLQMACKERLAPFIYKEIANGTLGRAETLPPVINEKLKNTYYVTLSKNLSILRQLKDLLGAFSKNGIEAIVFKGLALAHFVYQDLGARPMADIDILVKKEDAPCVDRLLKDLGYSVPFDIKVFSSVDANLYHNSVLYESYSSSFGSAFVHVYWHLLNLFPYDRAILDKFSMDDIWNGSQVLDADGLALRTLSVEHDLIYLCMHAFKHGFSPTILLLDMACYINVFGKKIDWEILICDAYAFGLSKYVYYSFYVLSRATVINIPGQVFDALKPKKISFFERNFVRQLEEGRWRGGMAWVYFGMNETLMQRVVYLAGAIFPSRIEMALSRQKDPSKVSVYDYIDRVFSALKP